MTLDTGDQGLQSLTDLTLLIGDMEVGLGALGEGGDVYGQMETGLEELGGLLVIGIKAQYKKPLMSLKILLPEEMEAIFGEDGDMWNFIKDFADMVPEELGTPNGNDGILGEFNTFYGTQGLG